MTIGIGAPHANRDDVEREMLVAQEDCTGDILDATDPLVDPAAATLEGFPDGPAYACPILWLRNESGELFYSTDDGSSYVALGGTASNSTIVSQLVNRSGGQLDPADVVVWDYANELSVDNTSTRNDPLVAGIWQQTTGSLQSGSMIVRGLATVNVDAATDVGDRLITSATPGLVAPAGNAEGVTGLVGYALEASVGAGAILALIDIQTYAHTAACFTYELAQNTDGPTFTAGGDRTIPVNTEKYDFGGIASVAGNQVTIQPGIYSLELQASMRGASAGNALTRLILHNITTAADIDESSNFHLTQNNMVNAVLSVDVVLPVATTLELRVRTTATTQAALALNIAGKVERYARWIIRRKNL